MTRKEALAVSEIACARRTDWRYLSRRHEPLISCARDENYLPDSPGGVSGGSYLKSQVQNLPESTLPADLDWQTPAASDIIFWHIDWE